MIFSLSRYRYNSGRTETQRLYCDHRLGSIDADDSRARRPQRPGSVRELAIVHSHPFGTLAIDLRAPSTTSALQAALPMTWRLDPTAGARVMSMWLAFAATATAPAFPPATTYAWRGHTCSFVKAGSGPPVVLLHGFAVNAQPWIVQYCD